MKINAQFRDPTLSPHDFVDVLNRLGSIIDSIVQKHGELQKNRWRMKRDSQTEAGLYSAFDEAGASLTALAVLKEEFRNSPNRTYVSIWDGSDAAASGISMVCHVGRPGALNLFAIEMFGEYALAELTTVASIVTRTVQKFNPAYVTVSPTDYFEKRVFDDKPGVGWMLYLPKIVTMQQVPEARALIPIPVGGKQQTGTIIVSVADTVFSIDDPEHIEIANRIEIRLVDQELLPRYVDL
ncbi:immunity 52 family protein [Paraburkholderia bryophila]|uniref:immunity 52 family protein n=1 Tax=Paraburkholderia bryophila TaxID=420952 RepID=UPI00234AEFEE|nr:immunity 52 family protein [Paraburkholderia bryophila]WCM21907.1 immunity 52 family protein [Paraburkholderia bryophila]